MCLHEDGSAGSLVYTTGLHTNNTVLNDIYNTNAVLSAKSVQLGDDVRSFHLLAV